MSMNDKILIELKPYRLDRKVEVYKNLHTGLWSVRQDGKVIIHASHMFLREAKYVVQPSGRERVLREKRKNVHAFVRGYICRAADIREATKHFSDEELHYIPAYYNPYTCETFVDKKTGITIAQSDFCDMMVDDLDPVIAIWKTKEIKE